MRLRKRIKLMPGVHLNVGLKGVSASVGRPGATANIGRKGVTGTVGVPGTGVSHSAKIHGSTSRGASSFPWSTLVLIGIAVAVVIAILRSV